MAIDQTVVWAGPDSKIVDLTCNDNSTSVSIAHGLAAAPSDVALTLLRTQGAACLWRWQSADATSVVVARTSDESSESTSPQLRVIIRRPHSIGR